MRLSIRLLLPPLAVAVATAAGLAGATPASAGTYTVHSCRLPNGAPASTADWALERRRTSSGTLTSACGTRGPLTLQLTPNASHPSDDSASVLFRAPAHTELRAYRIHRSVRLASRYNYWRWDLPLATEVEACHTTEGTCGKLGDPADPFGAGNLIRTEDRSGVTGVQIKLTCGESDTGSTACPAANPAAVVHIHRAELSLYDGFVPTFDAEPQGPLLSGAELTGAQSVWIAASDRGSGVYRASLHVDGQAMTSKVLDASGGRCGEPFTHARPCASQAAGELVLDTAQLADGEHTLKIAVSDATGTNVAEWGPARIVTANHACTPRPRTDALGLSIGFASGGSDEAPVLRTRVTRRWGDTSQLRGRLVTPAGAPVAGASVCVAGREDRPDAPLVAYGTTTTDGEGRFAAAVPAGPSREILAIHRTTGGAVVATAQVRVKARPSLKPSRHRLLNGQRVKLRGRLARGPVPRRGVLVELQWQSGPRRWQTFGTTRTRADGRYRYAYRFRRTTGVQRYTMRALVAEQAAYPYARGASRPIKLVVRGR